MHSLRARIFEPERSASYLIRTLRFIPIYINLDILFVFANNTQCIYYHLKTFIADKVFPVQVIGFVNKSNCRCTLKIIK